MLVTLLGVIPVCRSSSGRACAPREERVHGQPIAASTTSVDLSKTNTLPEEATLEARGVLATPTQHGGGQRMRFGLSDFAVLMTSNTTRSCSETFLFDTLSSSACLDPLLVFRRRVHFLRLRSSLHQGF